MWIQESFFKYSVGILLVLLIIYLFYSTAPIFYPILMFIAAILLPLLFSILLYYMLRPLVRFFDRWLPKFLSIVLVFTLIGATLVLTGLIFGSQIAAEAKDLNALLPEKVEFIKLHTNEYIERLKDYIPFESIPNLKTLFINNLREINTILYNLVVNMITTLAGIAIALAITPFVLFYFLKDDALLSRFILRFVPAQYQSEVQKIMEDVDETLSEFIIAQMTIAFIVGFFLFIGYSVIGLPKALSLAVFAMVFYIIPILGTFIAIIPALIVGVTISLGMTLKVIIVMVVAHVLESDFLTPKLMSHKLKVHPLTVILLLLAAGKLWGLLGLLLVTPTYAILKVIVWNVYKISRLRYAKAKTKASESAERLPE